MAITEPWQVACEVCNIDGYFFLFISDRPGESEGVLVWCCDTLCPSLLSVCVSGGVEAARIKTYPASPPDQIPSVQLHTAYHPPYSPTGPALNEHIIALVDLFCVNYSKAKFAQCGDMN